MFRKKEQGKGESSAQEKAVAGIVVGWAFWLRPWLGLRVGQKSRFEVSF